MTKKSNRISPEFFVKDQEINSFNQIYIENYFTYVKSKSTLPYQGWKIHISGNIYNYKEILNIVSNICVANQVSFKFINNDESVITCFAKGNSPFSTGKFITIYPSNEIVFKDIIEKLHQKTKDFDGASIITDREYRGNTVLYYRYGVINCNDEVINEERPKLFDEDGNPYEDIQGPFFSLPPFIKDIIIEEENNIISTGKVTLNKGRYEIHKILKVSNSGNVYFGTDIHTNEKVVIKEARHDIHTNGIEIKRLLENEIHVLRNVKSSYLPKYIDHFYYENNTYLVEEFIEGITLEDMSIEFNLPYDKFLSKKNIDKGEIVNKIIIALENLHQSGLVIEDVSPKNIIYSNRRIVFIDFETSYFVNEKPILATTNKLFGNFLFDKNGIKKDNQKLGFVLIDLLTKASLLLKFDSTGDRTIKLFMDTCLKYKFDSELINIILQMINSKYNIKQYKRKMAEENKDIIQKINELNDLKNLLVSTLVKNNSSVINVQNNILNYYLTNKYYNLILNKNCSIDYGYYKNDSNNEHKSLLYIKTKTLEGDFEFTRNYILDFTNTKTEKTMADLILLLSVINDYLKNRNHDSEIMKIFERTIEHIKKNKLKKHQGKLLVKCTDDYLSAYISNGNSGLIIELIRYSKITKLNKYNDFILDLSKILNVSYAKDTGFTHGLSGIGYANLELFRYFKNYIFLSNALNICGKLEMYTVNSEGDVYLCNPSLDSISFDFFSGITGQIFLLDQTHSQVMEVMKNEKIPQRI